MEDSPKTHRRLYDLENSCGPITHIYIRYSGVVLLVLYMQLLAGSRRLRDAVATVVDGCCEGSWSATEHSAAVGTVAWLGDRNKKRDATLRARSDRSGTRCRHDQVPAARFAPPITLARGRSVSTLAVRACCGLSVRGLLSCLALSTVSKTPMDMKLSVYASVTVDGP